jgi:hypothetical protein
VTRRCARKGAVLVESSIITVLFMVLFVGILDMGQVLFFHGFLNDRVRTAARYAIVHTYDPTAIKNIVAYNTSTPGDNANGLFGLTPSMVQVNRYDPGTETERIEVLVQGYTMHFVSPWLMRTFSPGPFRAVMPVEGAGAAH